MVWAPLRCGTEVNEQSGWLADCGDDAPMVLVCLPIDACSRPVDVHMRWAGQLQGRASWEVGGLEEGSGLCLPLAGARAPGCSGAEAGEPEPTQLNELAATGGRNVAPCLVTAAPCRREALPPTGTLQRRMW